jgi:hypothetical protein
MAGAAKSADHDEISKCTINNSAATLVKIQKLISSLSALIATRLFTDIEVAPPKAKENYL